MSGNRNWQMASRLFTFAWIPFLALSCVLGRFVGSLSTKNVEDVRCLVCEKMSMDDGYYRKLSVLYKDFECWMPFQPAQEDELTRHAGFSGTRVSSPTAGHDATKDARAGSIPTNKKCWSTRKFCNFCRQNGHMSEYYEGHRLRDASGRLECPILRAHVCDVCGATGDEAHTLSYCPVLKAAGVAPPKTALLLKNTLYDSCGRRRRPY